MSKKNDNDIVFSYSSDMKMPEHYFDKKGNFIGNANRKNDGIIRIKRENRGGKIVSLVYGFDEKVDINEICSEMKKKFGCGGSVKVPNIEIQGDKVNEIDQFLKSKNFKTKII